MRLQFVNVNVNVVVDVVVIRKRASIAAITVDVYVNDRFAWLLFSLFRHDRDPDRERDRNPLIDHVKRPRSGSRSRSRYRNLAISGQTLSPRNVAPFR